jgi:DNA-binding HxlR family transcriptional regulator
MPTSRSYGDACGIARALDVVGERWALLVVRELLLGPQRFSELRRALPHASSNLLSDRLRELQAHGVLRRRKLPHPAGSWVYELSEIGRQLEPIVLALGNWGLQFPPSSAPTTLSGVSVLLYLKTHLRLEVSMPPTTVRVELGDEVWSVRVAGEELTIEPGEPAAAEVTIRTDPNTLDTLFHDSEALDALVLEGALTTFGRRDSLLTLLTAIDNDEVDNQAGALKR